MTEECIAIHHSVLWPRWGLGRLLCHDTAGRPGHDTALARGTAPATRRLAPMTRRLAPATRRLAPATRGLAPATQQPLRCDTAMRARLGAPGWAGWANRLCTWCTQPVFGLSIVYESLFWHCL